jgi:hypothetical protein
MVCGEDKDEAKGEVAVDPDRAAVVMRAGTAMATTAATTLGLSVVMSERVDDDDHEEYSGRRFMAQSNRAGCTQYPW